jgi:hypothetical protein
MIYTTEQKIAALEREIKLRQQVYPLRIRNHRMSQQQADYQIDVMQSMLEDYKRIETKERLL